MKKNKGISLIVLIITVVVIIILGTAIIVNIAKTNIIGNVNEAVVKQDFKTMQEELNMYIADLFASSKGEFDIITVDASTEDEVKKILKSSAKSKYIEYVTIVDGKIVISDTMPEEQKEWASEAINGVGNVTPSTPDVPETPTEPEKTYTPIIEVEKEVTTANSTITGGEFLSTNPVIPVGFKAKETNDASWDVENDIVKGWNDGLVIEDGSGNEFVWVPCTIKGENGAIKYTKNLNYPKNLQIASVSDDTSALPNGVEKESSQINTYGGFYIGRYEAGVPANQTTIDGTKGNGSTSKSDVDGIPIVQRGATVWTYISYEKAMPNAKKLYESSTSVKSALITGTQWDTVCTWIHSEKDSAGNSIHDVTNSLSWGNYTGTTGKAQNDTNGNKISGTKQTAGKSEYWKAKNIYDIAGNTYEWTTEEYSNCFINRGSRFNESGSHGPASYRNFSFSTDCVDHISFRIVLYIL